ncbi:MAG: uroporphyrinogen-III C-methyltransferase [Pseudomonadota bacterium]
MSAGDERRVLNTRPVGQTETLDAALADAGFAVDHLPALAIEPIDAAAITSAYTAELPADFAVFVSRNAVDHGFGALAFDTTKTRIVAIGAATADALTAAGVGDVIVNPGVRSEDLLTLDAWQGDLSGQRIVIVRGDDGREVLRDTLLERGASVDVVDVYKRVLPEPDPSEVERVCTALDDDHYNAVAVMSLATMTNLETILGTGRMARATVVTPSRGVVEQREQAGASGATILTDSADPAAIVAAIPTEAPTPASDSTTAAPPADTPPPTPPAPPPVERKGGGLALILSIAALAMSAVALYQTTRSPAAPEPVAAAETTTPAATTTTVDAAEASAALDALRRTVTAAGDTSSANQTAIAELETAQAALQRRLAEFDRQIGQRQDLLESLPGRVENVEQSVAGIQGIAAGTRTEWLLAEAEYYLQLANAQLQLARNPTLAAYGLELADQRVRELSDPAYTPVRRALADEMRALASVEQDDLEGVALELASLADSVATLPLRDEVAAQRAQLPDEVAETTGDDEEGSLGRLWRAAGEQLGKGFRVRKLDESLKPLMSPEASYFLRTNLALKFDTARLALLRNEQEAFERSLTDANAWLQDYFDTDSAAVANALTTLADLSDATLSTTYPDISGSLTLLRRTRSLASGVAATDEP